VKITAAALERLAFPRIREALAERASTYRGQERAFALVPLAEAGAVEQALSRVEEVVSGGALSLGGVSDIRPLLQRVAEGRLLEGTEILEIAYTMDASNTIRRSILASERPALGALAARLGSFDGALRLVREQLDTDGEVRNSATPRLRAIRRRLNPLRGRIRDRLQRLLATYSAYVQDPVITLRRDRYVIPVRASSRSHVPGIILDQSRSGSTVFVEPESVVPMNNELALLELEERDEVRRVLLALAQHLASASGLDETLEVLAELDLVNASARLAEDWRLARPRFSEEGRIHLVEARHPLVEGCVPNPISLDTDLRLLIVTGPNAGGKTVLLKTLGLAAVMAHAGLFVAADPDPAPELPLLEAVLTDIGDEQSIEASLSTYAGHLTNLKAILEQADERVLVLIDELGSGTDPVEGAALSQGILEQILDSGARGLVTTHLAPLKVFASETQGVCNAAMHFDVERLRPAYRLVVGQPGRSYALAIAERLGLPGDLLDRAAAILGPEGERLETLLEILEDQREALRYELEEAHEARVQACREAGLLRDQIETLRASEAEVLASAAARAEEMLQDTMQRAKELKRAATTEPSQRGRALEALQELRRNVQTQADRKHAGPVRRERDTLTPGTIVFVEPYDAEGPIVEVRGNQLVVQLGLLKVEVEPRDVRSVQRNEELRPVAIATGDARQESELNIRGERVEQGIEKVRDFILEAHALKVLRVRIVHGKGTGSLREAVRTYLKREKRVQRFEDAVPYEGGHGVTVAYLRP